MITILFYVIAGLGAGVVTGLAGLSAAVVITPILVSLCGFPSYDAVTIALASDVLASMMSAYTYYRNKNIDMKRGGLIVITAFVGTVIGSYCGYLFSQAQPDGLGYLSMFTTVFLGIKFLFKPITGGNTETMDLKSQEEKKKTALAMLLGCGIGWVCGFTGSGGGIMMLMVFTLVMKYNLKIAVGTSTMIMTVVAFTGTVSHIAMGAELYTAAMIIVVLSCLAGAVVSSQFANKCEIQRLNKIVGIVLVILGAVTIGIKIAA